MHYLVIVIEILVAVGLIIFVHELGHFMTAKWFGVRVRRFALGMGPIIVKYVYGETEYSLRWIPIGGFVDLVGEHPEAGEADDSRGLWRRPAWQKIVVFSAGVLMNAVLALVLFTLAPIFGVQVLTPVIGGVEPGTPAEKAGILPGDRVVAINSHPVKSFEDVLFNVALADAGTAFNVELQRQTSAGVETTVPVTVSSVRLAGFPMPMLGLRPEADPVIAKFMDSDTFAHKAGLEEGDRVLSVNGREVTTWRGLVKAVADAPPGVVHLKIRRGEKVQDLDVDPASVKVYEYGFLPPTKLEKVDAKSPADEAGLKAGDRIAAMQDAKWPSPKTVSDLVRTASGNPIHVVACAATRPLTRPPRRSFCATRVTRAWVSNWARPPRRRSRWARSSRTEPPMRPASGPAISCWRPARKAGPLTSGKT